VHAVLDRRGLVTHRRRRRSAATGTALSQPLEANALWCADYKGEFMLGNRRYCYPLTITDFASRYLLTCEALGTTQERFAFTVFERTFREFGVPLRNRTDNGVPFASADALYGLSKLAVWWLHLGIQIERIKPGHPQQNGRHERMHLTLKKQATKPAAAAVLQQQARFDAFVERYNQPRATDNTYLGSLSIATGDAVCGAPRSLSQHPPFGPKGPLRRLPDTCRLHCRTGPCSQCPIRRECP
jgi:putative transposase